MNDHENGDGSMDGLVDRLELIEEQPLQSRAASYAELQERLRVRLENRESRP